MSDEVSNPLIPQHIARNLIEFLKRTKCEGQEAIAWVEAFQFLQPHAADNTQGVPFGGLTPK
jgi:hypothetical protein